MAKQERALAPGELALARAALSAAHGKRRLDLILSAKDPAALVRALPAEELYFTIREIGLADAAPLVPLATLAQFRTFIDLDAWRGDRLDPQRALTWLRAARTGSRSDPKAAARWERKLSGIDRELLYAVLRSDLVIHDLEEDPDPEFDTDRFVRTTEGKFVVEFMAEGAEYAALRGILDDLYSANPFQAARLLTSLRWDLPSELEETALRWRTARLADLGFPSLEEALSWFAKPRASPFSEAGAPERPQGFFLASFAKGSLLDRGLEALPPQERPVAEAQLMAAANAVLVADQVDPAEPEEVRKAFEAARTLLELGLEARVKSPGAELEGAQSAEVLSSVPLKQLFQEGFGQVLDLRWRAERLVPEGRARERKEPFLDAPLGEALSALLSRRPRYFPGLELPREEWGTPAAGAHAARAFLSSLELSRTRSALELCQGLLELSRSLGLASPPGAEPALRLGTCYLTALANERLGRGFTVAPIPLAELPRAVRALASLDDPRLRGTGEPGALLAELARQRVLELRQLEDEGELKAERVTELFVRG